MQITGRTTPGNEAALFMETSGIVRDRLILTLPGYGPESCRSLSACLSAFSLFFNLTPSVFPLSFSCYLCGVVHLSSSILCLCFAVVSYLLPPTVSWVFSLFCLSTSCGLSSTCCGVKRLRDSGPAVSEMIVFAGGALSIYLQWKVRHMLGLRGTCISKEPLSFELVTDKCQVKCI